MVRLTVHCQLINFDCLITLDSKSRITMVEVQGTCINLGTFLRRLEYCREVGVKVMVQLLNLEDS